MTWGKFSYICRKANKTIKSDESASECISRIESEPNSQLYGDEIRSDSLCRKIFNDIGAITENAQAKKIFDIYSELDLPQHLSEPMQFKRVTIYLTFVTTVFFLVSIIYQLYVAPSFMELFVIFMIPTPTLLLFYQQYWPLFFILIAALLVASVIVGFTLRSLFKFRQNIEKSFVFRFLTFKGIRTSYLKIVDILSFPVSSLQVNSISENSKIIEHLTEVENSAMSLAVEMESLLRLEMQSLSECCERQMRLILALVAAIIVVAIFFFLVGVYSPIFVLGEVV